MKKIIVLMLVLFTSFILVSCTTNSIEVDKTDSIKIDLKKDDIKVMQLTDIHLTYGFDFLDKKTFGLIDKMIEVEKPDIIIVTGDIFMTILAKSVFKKFIKFIDSYNIPWSLTFGNHEVEYHKMETIINVLVKTKTNNLYYLSNPNLVPNKENGYSNFVLEIYNDTKPILNIYLLDSKNNRSDIKDNDNPYDFLSTKQVAWYSNHVKDDTVKSLAFMHMPLRQYLLYDGTEGLNEKVWPQGRDTGFYDAMTNPEIGNGKTLGVFVGHDHTNSFGFTIGDDNILLAYGVSTGYNSYGSNNKGSRIINFNYNNQSIVSYLVDSKVVNYE